MYYEIIREGNLDDEFEVEYYRVKVVRRKGSGRKATEEWYHDPEPRDDLKLHRINGAARIEYDPITGKERRIEHHKMGKRTLAAGPRPPTFPKPKP